MGPPPMPGSPRSPKSPRRSGGSSPFVQTAMEISPALVLAVVAALAALAVGALDLTHEVTLGIDLGAVRYFDNDSAGLDQGGGTGGSRSAMMAGGAAQRAAEAVLDALFLAEALLITLTLYQALEFWLETSDALLRRGDVAFARARAHRRVQRIAEDFWEVFLVWPFLRESYRFVAAQDAGHAIHPAYVEGQIQGAVAQGVGWALNEGYVYGPDGVLQNAGWLDYRMPVASDLPMLDALIVEVPNPNHPFGVKGVAEAGMVAALACVANAIADATAATRGYTRDVPTGYCMTVEPKAKALWTVINDVRPAQMGPAADGACPADGGCRTTAAEVRPSTAPPPPTYTTRTATRATTGSARCEAPCAWTPLACSPSPPSRPRAKTGDRV